MVSIIKENELKNLTKTFEIEKGKNTTNEAAYKANEKQINGLNAELARLTRQAAVTVNAAAAHTERKDDVNNTIVLINKKQASLKQEIDAYRQKIAAQKKVTTELHDITAKCAANKALISGTEQSIKKLTSEIEELYANLDQCTKYSENMIHSDLKEGDKHSIDYYEKAKTYYEYAKGEVAIKEKHKNELEEHKKNAPGVVATK